MADWVNGYSSKFIIPFSIFYANLIRNVLFVLSHVLFCTTVLSAIRPGSCQVVEMGSGCGFYKKGGLIAF